MKMQVWSQGSASFSLDPQYQELGIRAAITKGGDIADAITYCADSDLSDISTDDFAILTEDDGTLVWFGWLTSGLEDPVPQGAVNVLAALHRTESGYETLKREAAQMPPEQLRQTMEQSRDKYVDDLEQLAAARPQMESMIRGMARMVLQEYPDATGRELAAACTASIAIIELGAREGTTLTAQGVVNLMVLAARRIPGEHV